MHSSCLFRPALLLALLAPTAGAQTTWFVDDDGPGDPFPGVSVPGNPAFSDPLEDGSAAHPYDDIEKAIAVASSGDLIEVLPSNVIGYYALSSTIELLGKALTIRSTDGAAVTVLDGTGIPGQAGMLVDGNAVIEGFTLRLFDRGSASPDYGGAMEITALSPVIRSCVFVQNHAYRGAAIYLLDSDAVIEDCRFEDNLVSHQGGALYVQEGHPVLRRSHLEGNAADYAGAIILFGGSGSLFTVEDCVFLENAATATNGYGGALGQFFGGQLLVERSRFIGNSCAETGGALRLDANATVRNSTFVANACANDKGAVHVGSGFTASIQSSTFTGNQGGAVAEPATVTFATMVNCIVWANSPFEVTVNVGVSYSDVLGGHAGPGNVNVDPVFQNPMGPDGILGTLDDDLTLFDGSPCIDAGNTTAANFPYPTDLAGGKRVMDDPDVADTGIALVGQAIDMGAYEVQHVCRGLQTRMRRLP